MTVIFLKPVGDFLKGYRLLLSVYRLLNGDNVHTYAHAAGRHHMRYACQGDVGHTLKKACYRGVFLNAVKGGVEKLRRARHKERQPVSFDFGRVFYGVVIFEIMGVIVAVIIFDNADNGHLLIYLFNVFRVNAFVKLDEVVKRVVFAQFHLVAKVNHFGRENLAQAPVFGVVGCNSAYFVNHDIGDFFAEFHIIFLNVFFVLIFAYYRFALFKHKFTSRIVSV